MRNEDEKRGKTRTSLFFYRDSHGNEVALLIKKGSTFLPIEIKSAETFNNAFLQGIGRFKETVGADHCSSAMVCHNGDMRTTVQEIDVFNPLRHQSPGIIAKKLFADIDGRMHLQI
jgi:uncharacterized protein